MISINIHQAKTHLSKYIQDLQTGKEDEVILCKNNEPLARVLPIKKQKAQRPEPGLGKGIVLDMSNFEYSDRELNNLFYVPILSEPKSTYKSKNKRSKTTKK